jgi:dimethylamine/trimethylamine dehydrogenase
VTRPARHDILFEPLTIGSKTFRNRFYSVPHASFHPGRRLSDIAFRRMKAEGGWAAVCGGVVSLRADSWGGFVPRIWDDDDREVLRRMATEITGQGALAGIELGHGGAMGEGDKFTPSLGASQLADPDRGRFVPKEMDLDDIRRLQDDWVAAAVTAADLGFDIVYAYGAHGYLPAQFLSPWFNRRTDAYGGSLENRARFWTEMIDRFRSAIGDRCVIAVRIAAENLSPHGHSAQDTLAFVRHVDDLVDLWDVNVGKAWAHDSAPFRAASEGWQVEFSGRVRSATDKPIVGVSRLTTPDAMADVLRSGVWDLIGGARPGIADPFLPRKIEEGRADDIRECTGGNVCISVETLGTGLSCVQNPTIGEEFRRRWHPERYDPPRDPDRHVLVVGAGPAGMECARVLGERGFAGVHLVDAAPAIGGHLRWLRLVPGIAGMGRVLDHRLVHLGKLDNVAVVTGTRLDVAAVLDYGADAVVVATGSHWLGAESDLHGLALAEWAAGGLTVLTPEDVMAGGRRGPGPVVVWDGESGGVACGVAHLLAAEGATVTMTTRFGQVAPSLDATFEGATARAALHELGVAMRTGVTPIGWDDGVLRLRGPWDDEVVIEARTLVVATQRRSDDSLYRALRSDPTALRAAGVPTVVRIGDCVNPRSLVYVVADGHRMGRELDASTPEIPLTPRRERDIEAPTADMTSRRPR